MRQIKDVLKRVGKKPTSKELREWTFMINNHVQNDGSGTAAQRFFRRGVRTLLPNSIIREVDHRALIKKRHEKQMKIATQKGRSSKDAFKIGDLVSVQDNKSGKWCHKGKISECRLADDGYVQSHMIEMSDGSGSILRHQRFIKHDIWPVARQSVRFSLNSEADEASTADQAPLHAGQA